MKILFLTSRLPYPPYRGDKLKIWNLMRQVSRAHEVALLSFVQSEKEREFLDPLRSVCARVDVVHLPVHQSLLRCLLGVPGTDPFQIAYFQSADMEQALSSMINEWHPDLIHTHLIRMAPYTAAMRTIPRVLDMTDAVSLYLDRFRQSSRNPLKRLLLSWEYERMKRFEPIIRDFQRALVCSEVDRDALRTTVPDASIDLLFNGVDTEVFFRSPADAIEPARIIFTGNMSYFPNADGARYFTREIFPRIRKAVPGVCLYIVGQNPPRSVRALAANDIVVTGFVKDIRKEYARSRVAVSPIRFGAGTLNKILEPLAMGIPVVATSNGVAGLDLKPDEGLHLADDPDTFAQSVVGILTSPLPAEGADQRLMRTIRERFSWDAIGTSLLRLYEELGTCLKVDAR